MQLLFLAFSFWLGYLGVEVIRLRRWRESIPLRISVTGTRGKSSVARMLAAVLRDNGKRVLTKTTGSQARIVLPDGTEIQVGRRGVPSVLEQIRFLHLAARERAEVVVVEVMSVHPENHRVESEKILRPHMVLMTNFRVDHAEAAGWTREEVARLHLSDVVPGATVVVPEGELVQGFARAVADKGGHLVAVPSPKADSWSHAESPAILEGTALVEAALGPLGIPVEHHRGDLAAVALDAGAFRIRPYPGRGGGSAHTVNAFAANDPHSTGLLLDWTMQRLDREEGSRRLVGLLCLRGDRGDRSVQWLRAMEGGFLDRFDHLYVQGFHASAFRRSMNRRGRAEGITVLSRLDPESLMARILSEAGGKTVVVFGFGNFGGMGETLVRHWMKMAAVRGAVAGSADPGPKELGDRVGRHGP